MSIPSILLIREDTEQWTGSDCCGKLEGDNIQLDKEKVRVIGEMGSLFMDLKSRFQNVLLVDPRNQPYLFPRILLDLVRYHLSLKEALKTIFMVYSIPAVILNGKVLYSGNIPKTSFVIQKIRSELNSGNG